MRTANKVAALAAAMVIAGGSVVALTGPAEAKAIVFQANLKDPSGAGVGSVVFSIRKDSMHVEARMRPNQYVTAGAFHGFHVHKSTTAAVTKCEADPGAASTTWFVSAGGHLAAAGQTHGMHAGDMPSPLVMADGTAKLSFDTDRIDPSALTGTAVILHAKPDNFGNVPTGDAADQYTPNSPSATDLTARTGNSGDRVACGQVRRSS